LQDSQSQQLYTIKQLERANGVPKRTIHFYVKEGLLPPPEGRGSSAHYDERHYLRLLLIQHIKAATYLRLEGIREVMEPLTTDELREYVRRFEGRSVDGPPLLGEQPGAIRSRRLGATQSGPRVGMFDSRIATTSADDGSKILDLELSRDLSDRDEQHPGDDAPLQSNIDLPLEATPAADVWHRVRINDNVEIHFRNEADTGFRKKLRNLISRAKKTFSG